MSSTTAGTALPRRWPRHRLLVAALVVSAVLNVFFIAGAAWTRIVPAAEVPSPAQRYHQITQELGLDQKQRVSFDRYVAAMRARSNRLHQEVGRLIGSAWDEVAKPQADTQQILGLLDQTTDKRREFQHEAAVQTLDFLSLLSPEQRSKFVAIARERRAPWWRPQPQNR